MAKTWKNTFRVGVYKCELSYIENVGMTARWDPHLPKHKFSEQEWKQYRSGRDALAAEVAKDLGGSVLVIEA